LETSFFQFLQKGYNPLLALTALIAGAMLLWPLVRLLSRLENRAVARA